jgi:hypothetical protein
MDVLNPSPLEHAPKNKGGRPRGSMVLSKRTFVELCRKNPREAFENLRKLALHGENDYVRVAATKIWIEYAAGKPPEGEGGGAGPSIVNVITGVRGDGDISATPPARPLLPDGRDPFETHGGKPAARPISRAPAVEPVQHRLFEREPPDKSTG